MISMNALLIVNFKLIVLDWKSDLVPQYYTVVP